MLKLDAVMPYLKGTGIEWVIETKNDPYKDGAIKTLVLMDTKLTDKNEFHYALKIKEYLQGGCVVQISKWTPMVSQLLCQNVCEADFLRNSVEYIKGKLSA